MLYPLYIITKPITKPLYLRSIIEALSKNSLESVNTDCFTLFLLLQSQLQSQMSTYLRSITEALSKNSLESEESDCVTLFILLESQLQSQMSTY